MKIKIYQIDMERDEHRIAMMGYEETLARLNGDSIDSALYDLVFDGKVEAKDLEAVYAKFNLDHPAGYTGRSMSVSDVVQVVESTTAKEGYYFCDSIGFKEIPFQPELTKNALPRTIDVVLVEPGKLAHPAKITATLEGMQAVVGGDIEPFYPCSFPPRRTTVYPLCLLISCLVSILFVSCLSDVVCFSLLAPTFSSCSLASRRYFSVAGHIASLSKKSKASTNATAPPVIKKSAKLHTANPKRLKSTISRTP